ncbi:response regulator transcription factor [Paenibacillus sp. S-38]|uniref:response regulator transcription factor n=1 Tax=Paenibacillus sp. S-38 TaxID=3416710 RepID=UPI003CECB620
MKLLIADDQRSLHQFLHTVVDWAALGIAEVQSAYDGEEAAELAASMEPDLLLMDIRMPGVDGIEALRRIQSLPNKPKAVILSAYDQFEYAREALKLSVSQYLLKPVDTELLEGALRELITGIRAEARSLLERELAHLSLAGRLPDERLAAAEQALGRLGIGRCAALTRMAGPEEDSASLRTVPVALRSEGTVLLPLLTGGGEGEQVFFAGLRVGVEREALCAGLERCAAAEDETSAVFELSRLTGSLREFPQLIAESREAALRAREGSGEAAPRMMEKLRCIRSHIDSHLEGDLSLQTVADRFGIDKFQLSRTFKQAFGENYWPYVTRRRLEKAAQLLCGTDWKNGRIAEATGYADESHFSKAFKKHFGMAPKEYRAAGAGPAAR